MCRRQMSSRCSGLYPCKPQGVATNDTTSREQSVKSHARLLQPALVSSQVISSAPTCCPLVWKPPSRCKASQYRLFIGGKQGPDLMLSSFGMQWPPLRSSLAAKWRWALPVPAFSKAQIEAGSCRAHSVLQQAPQARAVSRGVQSLLLVSRFDAIPKHTIERVRSNRRPWHVTPFPRSAALLGVLDQLWS